MKTPMSIPGNDSVADSPTHSMTRPGWWLRFRLRRVPAAILAAALLPCILWLALRHRSPPAPARPIGARLDLAAGDVAIVEGAVSRKALSGTPLTVDARV